MTYPSLQQTRPSYYFDCSQIISEMRQLLAEEGFSSWLRNVWIEGRMSFCTYWNSSFSRSIDDSWRKLAVSVLMLRVIERVVRVELDWEPFSSSLLSWMLILKTSLMRSMHTLKLLAHLLRLWWPHPARIIHVKNVSANLTITRILWVAMSPRPRKGSLMMMRSLFPTTKALPMLIPPHISISMSPKFLHLPCRLVLHLPSLIAPNLITQRFKPKFLNFKDSWNALRERYVNHTASHSTSNFLPFSDLDTHDSPLGYLKCANLTTLLDKRV